MSKEKNKEKNLKKELEECCKLKDQYLDSWKRERADFLNYKKEGSQRMESLTEYVKMSMILRFLPVVDSFDLAIEKIPEKLKKDENVKGLFQIRKKMLDFLRTEGVSSFESLNEKFNPELHDVVESVEKKGVDSGVIIKEIQKGYKIKNKLLRPAKVKVVK